MIDDLLSAEEVTTSTKLGSIEAPFLVVANTLNLYFLFGNNPVTIRLNSYLLFITIGGWTKPGDSAVLLNTAKN